MFLSNCIMKMTMEIICPYVRAAASLSAKKRMVRFRICRCCALSEYSDKAELFLDYLNYSICMSWMPCHHQCSKSQSKPYSSNTAIWRNRQVLLFGWLQLTKCFHS